MEPAAERSASALADRESELQALLLAHPLRARIAAELAEQTREPAELAAHLDEPVALVSYHRRVLWEAGD